jgi:hypothetical protein
MTQNATPTMTHLIDWLEGRLAPPDAERVAQAVADEPGLQQQVAWLRDFLQISQTTVLAQPPDAVRRGAIAAFAAYEKKKRPLPSLQTFIANLTADTWQRPALAGVRNVSLRHEPRQLIFSTDQADIALNAQFQPDAQKIDLDGQIFPLDDSNPADYLVQLLHNGLEQRLISCDALGKFRLNGLPTGTYHLLLSSDQATIEIGPVVLE